MKRILKISVLVGAATILAGLVSPSRCAAQSGPIVNVPAGRFYGVYGPSSTRYSRYGYSPYRYGTAPGYVYPSYWGYGTPDRRRYLYLGYNDSPGFGHAYGSDPVYRPYGYDVYGPYGYKHHGY